MIAEVASQAHNLKVVGSNPTPATKLFLTIKIRLWISRILRRNLFRKNFRRELNVFNRLFIEAGNGTFEENDLFDYEMACIKQALSFSEFFKEMSLEECKAFYEKYPSLFELIEAIKDKLPYYDKGHSGNSMSMSWMLYRCYKEKPELVPYMHGCLAQLVGDEGYHDNRSDVPKL